MNQIIEQLPKAKFWAGFSLFFSIFGVISQGRSIFTGDGVFSALIGLVFQLFLIYFLYLYYNACKNGHLSEAEQDIEDACKQQSRVLMMYGIQSLLLIIFLAAGFIIAVGMSAGFGR